MTWTSTYHSSPPRFNNQVLTQAWTGVTPDTVKQSRQLPPQPHLILPKDRRLPHWQRPLPCLMPPCRFLNPLHQLQASLSPQTRRLLPPSLPGHLTGPLQGEATPPGPPPPVSPPMPPSLLNL